MTALLSAHGVNKSFAQGDARNQVLTDVSVTINSGDFVAIMGPSGSGKSTLLYCLSGMDPVDSGEIRLEDVDIATLSEDERTSLRGERMGFVFQDANLLESLNVLDNILFAAALRGHARMDELRARARELMELTGISELEDRGVTEVSGGQRQRVSLCRALLHQPAVLFGDEPTGALNSQASADVIALFRTLNAQGTTMLIVTHDARVAASASRVLFLSDGRTVDEVHLMRDLTPGEREERVGAAM